MPPDPKSPPHQLAVQLEQLAALDGPADFVAGQLQAAIPEGPVREALRGDHLGHSLHPLLTDLPIGFWTSSVVLDLIGGGSSHRAADTLVLGGILSYLPAAATGASDWSEKTAPGPMRRVGLVHAALNAGALTLFIASFGNRLRGRRARARLLSLAGAGVLGAAGYLGGHLAYAGGVGVEQPLTGAGSAPVADDPAASAPRPPQGA